MEYQCERKRCPCGKLCYTESEAGGIVNSLKHRHKRSGNGDIPKRYYFCDICGMYHLTKKKANCERPKKRRM